MMTLRDLASPGPARSMGVKNGASVRGLSSPFMSDQAEHAFVKAFVNILASQPVTFDNDFQEQPANTLKRAPVLQVSTINPSLTSRPFTWT